MSEVKSDKSDATAKKLNDDFNFQQMKNAKSEFHSMLLPIYRFPTARCLFPVKLFWCKIYHSPASIFLEQSIIHVILLNRTLRILCALGIFCTLLPLVDYFYFYSTDITEYQIDDSGICSHYPIYQIPCGGEVSAFFVYASLAVFIRDGKIV